MMVYPTLKLRFPFEVMGMGEGMVAVPVEQGTESFHGIIKLQNESAQIMFRRLQDGITLPELIYVCMEQYPDSTVEEVGPKVIAFLDQMRDAKVLAMSLPEGFQPDGAESGAEDTP